jgi:peptidoglycan/LPS O-acetylase OafA/YrhL
MNKLQYKSQITLLRAISVVAVIFYHYKIEIFGKEFFKGGFVGVDIFFVISGYLFYSIITNNKSFHLLEFYLQRIRRILPPLLFLIVILLITALVLYDYEEFISILNQIPYSISHTINYYFLTKEEVYQYDRFKEIFLHLWSLSVEMQFYFLFPFFVLYIIKKNKNKLLILTGIVIINLLLLIYASYKINHNIIFYTLQFRLFEFLIGSIIAEIEQKNYNFSNITNDFLLIFGLGLIFFSIIFFRGVYIPWPSLYTLLPTTGAAMVILSKISKSRFKFYSLVLHNKIFAFIGLISYSLYLFHYPILIISKKYYGDIDLSINQKIILLIFTLIISTISFELFEKNFKKKFIKTKNISIIFICICLISLKFFDKKVKTFLYYIDTLKNKNGIIISTDQTGEPSPWFFYMNGKLCWNLYEDFCKVNGENTNSNKDIILIGDSILSAMSSEIVLELKKFNNLIFTNIALYGYFPNYEAKTHINSGLKENLVKVIKNRYEYIYKNNNIIVISGRFEPSWKDEIIIENILLPITDLLENNKVILILPIPFNENIKSYNIEKSKYIVTKKNYLNNTKKFINYIKTIRHKNFYIIDSYNLLCQSNEYYCETKIDNKLIYYDGLHLNNNGSKIIVKELKKIILDINNKK